MKTIKEIRSDGGITRTIKEIRSDFVDDENYRHIDVWFTEDENEEGKTVAIFCEDTGKHYFIDSIYSLDDGVKTTIEVLKHDWVTTHKHALDGALNDAILDDRTTIPEEHRHDFYKGLDCPIRQTTLKAMRRLNNDLERHDV